MTATAVRVSNRGAAVARAEIDAATDDAGAEACPWPEPELEPERAGAATATAMPAPSIVAAPAEGGVAIGAGAVPTAMVRAFGSIAFGVIDAALVSDLPPAIEVATSRFSHHQPPTADTAISAPKNQPVDAAKGRWVPVRGFEPIASSMRIDELSERRSRSAAVLAAKRLGFAPRDGCICELSRWVTPHTPVALLNSRWRVSRSRHLTDRRSSTVSMCGRGHTAPLRSKHARTMLYLVAIYFGVATLALALLALPQARALALVWARRLVSGSAATHRRVAARSQRQASDALNGMGSVTRAGRNWVSQRRPWLLAGAALLVAGPLIAVALALRGFLSLDGYDHRLSRSVNDQVAMLLRGEQLVPPAALPPELFITPEMERAIPMIRIASRQWDLLDGDFRQRMLVVFKLMKEQHGIDMVLLEGYRSPERQAQLAALGGHVTRAGAYESYHQYGLAADCAFLRDGRIVIAEQDPWVAAAYAHYGEVARSVGLTWGGGWQSIRDFGHAELRREGVLPKRAEAQGPK